MSDVVEEVPEKIVEYGGGEREFERDESVTGFTVKPGVTRIAAGAFLDCIYLRSLNGMIGSNVTEVDNEAFERCESLELLEGLPCELEWIGKYAFYWSGITSLKGLPEVEVIQEGTFGWTRITTLEGLSRSVKSIEMWAFNNCHFLTSLTSLPDSVTTLHHEAFEG